MNPASNAKYAADMAGARAARKFMAIIPATVVRVKA